MKKDAHEWDKPLDKNEVDSISACKRCGVIKKKVKTRTRYFPTSGPSVIKNPDCK
jgi:hypothetical protein